MATGGIRNGHLIGSAAWPGLLMVSDRFRRQSEGRCGYRVAPSFGMLGPCLTVLPEQGGDVVVALLDGDFDGRSSFSGPSIGLGTGLEQHSDHLDVAPRGGPHQHGDIAVTRGVSPDYS